MSGAYYSEFDAHAAQWLRNLIDAGHITPGVVDERDLREVRAEDVRHCRRFHAFAGIGGWDYALALAGWDATRPVWTGSCPCQPFSTAGKGKGKEDERHLWPVFAALIRQCRPDTIFGEQVASAAGYDWLDGVRADLEAEGYAFGAADLSAAGVGAPHIRQRLFWGASLSAARGVGHPANASGSGEQGRSGAARRRKAIDDGTASWVGDANGSGREARLRNLASGDAERSGELATSGSGRTDGLGHPIGDGLQGQHCPRLSPGATERADGAGAGFWDAFDLLPCRDGKVRRAQSGILPVVNGAAFRLADGTAGHGSRAKALRGIGNAIVPQVAALFIRAFMEATA